MKALFLVRPGAEGRPGGDLIQARCTAAALRRLGVEVDLQTSVRPEMKGYDIAHVFGIFHPQTAALPVEACRRAGLPIVLSPIWWDLSEFFARSRAVERALKGPAGRIDRELERIRATSERALTSRRQRLDAQRRLEAQRSLMRMAGVLLPNSHIEAREYLNVLALHDVPIRVIHNGVSPDAFVSEDRHPNSIVCAGRIESRKNQAMLLYALRDLDVEITLFGNAYDPGYLELCKRFATPRVRFAGESTQANLFTQFARAQAHVLPSWVETPGIASLEAAAAGAQVVSAARGCEYEYFAETIEYADPGDPASIQRAVRRSLRRPARTPGDSLERRVRALSWEAAGEATLTAYRWLLGNGPLGLTV